MKGGDLFQPQLGHIELKYQPMCWKLWRAVVLLHLLFRQQPLRKRLKVVNWKERFPQKNLLRRVLQQRSQKERNPKQRNPKRLLVRRERRTLQWSRLLLLLCHWLHQLWMLRVPLSQLMLYKPKEFAEARLNFIKIQRAQGLSFAEASKSWSTSEERADLLADLPVSELKRRRFIRMILVHRLAGDPCD